MQERRQRMTQTDEQRQAYYESIIYLKTAREAFQEAECRLVKLNGYNLQTMANLDCAQRIQLRHYRERLLPLVNLIDKHISTLTSSKLNS